MRFVVKRMFKRVLKWFGIWYEDVCVRFGVILCLVFVVVVVVVRLFELSCGGLGCFNGPRNS